MRSFLKGSMIALSLLGSTAISHATSPIVPTCHQEQSQQQRCDQRVVEVMFVLDTTGSMAGLISGAKQKIWSIANEILDNDPNAIVRMGIVGYRDLGDAYVTRFFDLTEDIDSLYGKLLKFQARGGGDRPESVNQALNEGVARASWSPAREGNIRLVFLAGDAPPQMNYYHDVKYPETLRIARNRDITVHTLQAGRDHDTRKIWKKIARLGHGVYAQIPQSGNVQVIISPYDDQISYLQRQLEDTVIPYGNRALRSSYEQKIKTRRMAASPSAVADRAEYRSKIAGKREVVTGGGDLLAELEAGTVSANSLDAEKLPEKLRAASASERKALIEKQMKRRAEVDLKLNELLSKRAKFLKENAGKTRTPDAFDLVIRKSIRSAF